MLVDKVRDMAVDGDLNNIGPNRSNADYLYIDNMVALDMIHDIQVVDNVHTWVLDIVQIHISLHNLYNRTTYHPWVLSSDYGLEKMVVP
jgi:hypothetical protein